MSEKRLDAYDQCVCGHERQQHQDGGAAQVDGCDRFRLQYRYLASHPPSVAQADTHAGCSADPCRECELKVRSKVAALEADLEKMTRVAIENGDRYSAAEDRVSALARDKYALEAENKALQERLTRALNASGDLSAEFMAERAARLRAEEERDEAWVIRKATRTREIEANRARNEAMAEVGRLRAAARYALTCHEDVACSCDGCARLHAALAPVQAEEGKTHPPLRLCREISCRTFTLDRSPSGEPLCEDHGGFGPGSKNGEGR